MVTKIFYSAIFGGAAMWTYLFGWKGLVGFWLAGVTLCVISHIRNIGYGTKKFPAWMEMAFICIWPLILLAVFYFDLRRVWLSRSALRNKDAHPQ